MKEVHMKKYLPICIVLVLCVSSFFACTYTPNNLPTQEDPVQTTSSDTENTESSTDAFPVLPDGHIDFGLFSIELPEGFLLQDEELKCFNHVENLMVMVKYCPKNIYHQDTVDAFTRQSAKEAGAEDTYSISPANNPYYLIHSVEQPDFLSDWYCVVLDSEYYYIYVLFGSRSIDFEQYLPQFQQWESTIQFYAAETGMIFSSLKQWEIGQVKLTAPIHMGIAEAEGIGTVLVAPDDVRIYTGSYLKSKYPSITDIEAFRKSYFHDVAGIVFSTSACGNLCCTYPGSHSQIYSVVLENESSYIVVFYTAPTTLFDDYLPLFQQWEMEIELEQNIIFSVTQCNSIGFTIN